MSSTLDYRQPAPSPKVSRFATFTIAAAMLGLGFVLGSTGWLSTVPAQNAGAERSSIAAPESARKYTDWRGNSAGIRRGNSADLRQDSGSDTK